MSDKDMTIEDKNLIDFWDKAFSLSEEQKVELQEQPAEELEELAPSKELFQAACFLGKSKKVLDFGCGLGWAGIIAAKNGCSDVTVVDAAPSAIETAKLFIKQYGVENSVQALCASSNWLQSVEADTYDGLYCSNVLDVVPEKTAEAILKESARILTTGASVIIGLNYYLSEDAATARGMQLVDGNKLYVDGILRLVSRSDEEWERIFSPYYIVEKLEYFAWPGEPKPTRRLFWLKKR